MGLSWFGIFRVGLVQTALGAIIVLTTSTLNRVMVVELALPAMLPGALVAFHYAVQMLRPRWGHGSDGGRRRTPWIVGGMVVLASGGVLAAIGTALMAQSTAWGVAVATLAFLLIGIGVGAAGTNLLVFLATSVAPARRAAAASIVWMMMIAGFVVTAIFAGQFLDPFTMTRLVEVTASVGAIALAVTLLALWGLERGLRARAETPLGAEQAKQDTPFMEALREVWSEPKARQFTVFVFISMLAYSAQDLILEPFAGLVFGMTPGESTKLAGVQNGGVLLGMVLVAVAGSGFNKRPIGSLKLWTVGGCIGSGIVLACLAVSGHVGVGWPLKATVFALGLTNGAFAVAAIGSMMMLANEGHGSREGVRMGLWGAAQGIAFGLGGFAGTVAVDAVRAAVGSPLMAYSTVFAAEGVLFIVAAVLALRIDGAPRPVFQASGRAEPARPSFTPAAAEGYMSGLGGA